MQNFPKDDGYVKSGGLVVDADYRPEGRRYVGNPLNEALPRFLDENEIIELFSSDSPPPDDTYRKSRAVIRRQDLNELHDLTVFFHQHIQLTNAVQELIREAYHFRNPLTPEGKQWRIANAQKNLDSFYVDGRKSTARGHILMSISGMGKSTFAHKIYQTFPRVIKHTEFQGQPFACYQIPVIMLRIPHDGTIRSICVQFFQSIDEILGTNYLQEAYRLRVIGLMVDKMKQVAGLVSVGLLMIDEVQNLRTANGNQAEQMMNLFTELMEKVGVSILIMATPALGPLFHDSLRNTRKLMTSGSTVVSAMEEDGPQWEMFTEKLWAHCYLAEYRPLTNAIRKAWFKASAGVSAFAALVFYFAQRNEIQGQEFLDASSFEQAYTMDMAFLHPAIEALLSGDPDKLKRFDDLMVNIDLQEVRKSLGAKDQFVPNAPYVEEFDGNNSLSPVQEPTKQSKSNPMRFDQSIRSAPSFKIENPHQHWRLDSSGS